MSNDKGQFLCLVSLQSPEGDRTHIVEKSPFFVGRSTDSDIVYPHSSASRKHLQVQFDGEKIFVKDLGSANGTVLNKKSIEKNKEVPIAPGDQIGFGNGDIFLTFLCIPRPMELASLESQQQQLKIAMKDVVTTLTEEVRAELEEKFKTEISSEREKIGVQLKAKAEKEIEALRKEKLGSLEQDLESLSREFSSKQKELQEATAQASEVLITAKAQADQILTLAKTQADELQLGAREFVETFKSKNLETLKNDYDTAKKEQLSELEQSKSNLQAEILQLNAEIEEKSTQVRTEIDKIAARLLKESQDRIATQEAEASEKVAQLLRQSQNQFMEASKEAQNKADEILATARHEATQMRQLNQEEASLTRKKAFEQADAHMHQAKKDTEEHLKKMMSDGERRFAIMEEEKLSAIKDATEKKQREIILSHQETIQNLEKEIAAHRIAHERNGKELSQTLSLLQDSTQNLQSINQELSEKKVAFQTLLEKVERAESVIQQAEKSAKELARCEQEISRSKQLHQEQLSAQSADIKQKGEQLLLKHQDEVKALTQELNQKRLQAHEELKKQIDQEEKRIKEIRKHQSAELARMVELRLADRLKAAVPSSDLSSLTQDIFNAVKETLTNDEASLKPMTLHLDEARQEKIEKRKMGSKWAAIASASALVLLGVMNQNTLMKYFRSQDKNSVATQMIEQRKIQSIYQPTQNKEFRDTYMDNVLYMKNYYEVMSNVEFQKKWTLRLNDITVVKELGVSEEQMIKYVTIEANLVTELFQLRQSIDAVYLSEGLERMRKLEQNEKARLLGQVITIQNLNRIHAMQKESVEKFIADHSSQYP